MDQSLRIPLRNYPGMNRFTLDWIEGVEAATHLLPRHASGTSKPGTDAVDQTIARALVSSNATWNNDVEQIVSRWAAGGTVTIVAGQQVGFAGGPLYTIAKLATVVRMKRDLEAQGVPATAMFWLATEDHDFDEVATLALPASTLNRSNANGADLIRLRTRSKADPRTAVGALRVPETLGDELVSQLQIARPSWLRPGVTFRDSFAELVGALYPGEVILVDALLPELRRAGAELFAAIRDSEPEIQAALRERSTQIASAGYREQVVARDGEGYTLLFTLRDGIRRSDESTALPEETSTSAITRPLLQDAVLRPDVFVGGPAEVAYYAQIAPLHERFSIPLPRIALRGHLLLAGSPVMRSIARHQLAPDRLFLSPEEMVIAREQQAIAEISEIATAAKSNLLMAVDALRERAEPVDRGLKRSFDRSVAHLEYHFDRLEDRATKAFARKERERWSSLTRVAAELHPDGVVQDRVVAWVPYWLRDGRAFAERLVSEIEPDSNHFRITQT